MTHPTDNPERDIAGELLPCPFCGGKPEFINRHNSAFGVKCTCNGAAFHHTYSDNSQSDLGVRIDSAIRAWNTRAAFIVEAVNSYEKLKADCAETERKTIDLCIAMLERERLSSHCGEGTMEVHQRKRVDRYVDFGVGVLTKLRSALKESSNDR